MAHISTVKYLGYSFYRHKGKCRFRVHPKSVAKMKNRIRELTDRNKGISNEVREKKYQEYVRGWVEYFRLADMKETSPEKRTNGQDAESERSIGNSGRKSKQNAEC